MEKRKVESVSALFSEMAVKKAIAKRERGRLKREMDKLMDEADSLEAKAKSKRREAKDLYEQMGALDYGDWISDVVKPLADELASRVGKKADILGPCGIGAKVIISLVDDPEKPNYMQESLVLTIEPEHNDGKWVLKYETGDRSDRYAPGTVGFINGLNNTTAPLPDRVEEILGLFKMFPAADLGHNREEEGK